MGGKIPLEDDSPYLGMEGECDSNAWTAKYGLIENVAVIDNTLSV